ncbi:MULTISPECIES: formyltransferase family protein [unclassified Chitinophaga]|uniref:formyltransferase family protein n=1 Tax=unclassified Chitinophaga TaxID=2619133 RepID=UPI0009C47C4F|nr:MULTISPECIES: formyltransferase family protein [unclassified Chitinophaga]OMP79435.1 hypothetical protein BW716_10095 [[Flexibacter] sp. ATCC 35208]WPV66081.1 formyltransferase family protein [Chitinophaga sp. LS1]
MTIGIISSSDQFLPLAYTLANNNLQVCIFFAPGQDAYVNQKVNTLAAHFAMATGDVYNWLEQCKPTVVFVYGYPHLLDVSKFTMPVFNIHAGSLPAFRGPAPVFWQLKKGMPQLCLSIHVLTNRFDAGPVVWVKNIPDQPHYNYALVHQIFSQVVIEGVFFILQALAAGMPLPDLPAAGPAAYQKRPVAKDVLIDWNTMSATEICNLIRACNPWNKGAATRLNGQEIKLMDGMQSVMTTTLPPGSIVSEGLIAVKDGHCIQVNMLALEDIFVPAYHAEYYGIKQGLILQ